MAEHKEENLSRSGCLSVMNEMKKADAKKSCGVFRSVIQKIVFRMKLWEMDNIWYETGGSCWGLFPPSFYYTHTEEEIERITEETIRRIEELIEEM